MFRIMIFSEGCVERCSHFFMKEGVRIDLKTHGRGVLFGARSGVSVLQFFFRIHLSFFWIYNSVSVYFVALICNW